MSVGDDENEHESGRLEREERAIDDELDRGRKELDDAERAYHAEFEELQRAHPDKAADLRRAFDGKVQWLRAELARADTELHSMLENLRRPTDTAE